MDAETHVGAAMWAVRRVRGSGPGTMAADAGWRLFYDPAALEAWKVEQLAGVIYHELCHLLRAQASRARFADHGVLWNLTTDAKINDDLRAEDVTLPEGAGYPWSFELPRDRLAEEYYIALLEREAPPTPRGPAAGACGGSVTGELMDDIESVDSAAARASAPRGTWRVPPPIGDGEQEVIRRRVARDVDEHRRSAGSVPGHLARWSAERLDQPDPRRPGAGSATRAAVHPSAGRGGSRPGGAAPPPRPQLRGHRERRDARVGDHGHP
jgi:hypothetical protein